MRPEKETEVLNDLDHLPLDAELLATVGARHLAPIVYAVRLYGCRVAIIRPRGRFSFVGDKPIIGIIGDDGPARSLGPAGFSRKSCTRFIATCRTVAIVSSGAETMPYAMAAAVAFLMRKNVAIVETRPEHESAWTDLVRQAQPDAQLVLCRPRVH